MRYSNSKEKWAFFTQTEKAKTTLKELFLGRNPTVGGLFVVSMDFFFFFWSHVLSFFKLSM